MGGYLFPATELSFGWKGARVRIFIVCPENGIHRHFPGAMRVDGTVRPSSPEMVAGASACAHQRVK